MIDDLRGNS